MIPKPQIIFRFIRKFFYLKKEEEEAITYKEVEDNIYFYGHNLWMLGFSMILACIGLNMNLTLALIGAMLISPIMGPVIGMGFGLAIHDFAMINRAFRNWLIAISISLISSSLYFLITPLQDSTSQLLYYTRPTVFDALIAFFGGLCGFLGIARKDGYKVIAGVAIATACMPPLCTAGYGIATMQWSYIWGGFYFFMINCLFIGIGSMMLARYMRFTKKTDWKNANSFAAKHGKKLAYFLSILAIIPCIYIFVEMMHEGRFRKNTQKFMERISQQDHAILSREITYHKDTSIVSITFVGSAAEHQNEDSLLQLLKSYVPEKPVKLQLFYTRNDRATTQSDWDKLNLRLNIQDSLIQELQKKLPETAMFK